jgi:uncharacterized integral membrane protein
MFRIGTTLIVILAIGAGLLVGTLNSDRVALDLLWVQLDWPLGLLVMLFLAIGLLLGIAISYVLQVVPMRVQLRKEQRQTRASQDNLIPPSDD